MSTNPNSAISSTPPSTHPFAPIASIPAQVSPSDKSTKKRGLDDIAEDESVMCTQGISRPIKESRREKKCRLRNQEKVSVKPVEVQSKNSTTQLGRSPSRLKRKKSRLAKYGAVHAAASDVGSQVDTPIADASEISIEQDGGLLMGVEEEGEAVMGHESGVDVEGGLMVEGDLLLDVEGGNGPESSLGVEVDLFEELLVEDESGRIEQEFPATEGTDNVALGVEVEVAVADAILAEENAQESVKDASDCSSPGDIISPFLSLLPACYTAPRSTRSSPDNRASIGGTSRIPLWRQCIEPGTECHRRLSLSLSLSSSPSPSTPSEPLSVPPSPLHSPSPSPSTPSKDTLGGDHPSLGSNVPNDEDEESDISSLIQAAPESDGSGDIDDEHPSLYEDGLSGSPVPSLLINGGSQDVETQETRIVRTPSPERGENSRREVCNGNRKEQAGRRHVTHQSLEVEESVLGSRRGSSRGILEVEIPTRSRNGHREVVDEGSGVDGGNDDDDEDSEMDIGSETSSEGASHSEYEAEGDGEDDDDEEEEECTVRRPQANRGIAEEVTGGLGGDVCDDHLEDEESGQEEERELEDAEQRKEGGIGYQANRLCYRSNLAIERPMAGLPSLAQWFSMVGGYEKGAERIVAAAKENPRIKGASFVVNVPKRCVIALGEEKRVEHVRRCQVFKDRIAALGPDFAENCCVHAVHTTNLASSKIGVREQSKESIILEMETLWMMGLKILVIHVGSNKHDLTNVMFERLVADLQEILDEASDVVLAMENMTGRCGGETSIDLPSLRRIIDAVNRPGRLKVCLDLCHIYVSSYDLSSEGGRKAFVEDVDILGAENIAALHVSDSNIPHGGTEDSHANLGRGMIGLSATREILRNQRFVGIPTILETPAYFKGSRLTEKSGKHYVKMWSAERIRSWNELSMLWGVLQTSDEDFKIYEQTGWKEYVANRHKLEEKIYRGAMHQDTGPGVRKIFEKRRDAMKSVTARTRRSKTSRTDRSSGVVKKVYKSQKWRAAAGQVRAPDAHRMATRSRRP